MKTCGIELKGNEAIIVCLQKSGNEITQVHAEVKKIKLADSLDQESIRNFLSSINSFFASANLDAIGIKARATKGRFAGGSVSFKMEGLIQSTNFKVGVIPGATLKAKMKNDLEQWEKYGVNSYQKDALLLAAYLITKA